MVLQSEIRRASRRPGSYWNRVAAAAFATFALAVDSEGRFAGRQLFFTAFVLAFIACILDGARRAAGAIIDEKNEGALELLFLTPLSGPALILGKFAAIALAAFQTAMAALPILACGLILGGISFGEFFRSALALLHALSLAITVTLLLSASGKNSIAAMFKSTLVLLLGAVLFSVLGMRIFPQIWFLNPMGPILMITDGEFSRHPFGFFSSIALWQALDWLALRRLGQRLPARCLRENEIALAKTAPPIRSFTSFQRAPRWFRANPMQWLTLREMRMHRGRFALLAFALFYVGISFLAGNFSQMLILIGATALVAAYGVAAPAAIAKLRENGVLEIIITTPLGHRGVLRGHLAALRKVFLLPFLVVLPAFYFTCYEFTVESGMEGFEIYFLVGLIFLILATPWIGIWAALKARTPQRAIVWTLFWALIFPRFGVCFLLDAVYFFIAGLIAFLYVLINFRRLAARSN